MGDHKVFGCESKNHDHSICHGELWTCAACGLSICWQEGTHSGDAHLDNLCDTCWVIFTPPTPTPRAAGLVEA